MMLNKKKSQLKGNNILAITSILIIIFYIVLVSASAPTHTAPSINSTLGLNRTAENITGFNQSGADVSGDDIVFDYTFYLNNITNATRGIGLTNNKMYLPFDNNDTRDYINFNNGTQFNGVTCNGTGRINGGCTFDGVDDYIEINNPASFKFTNNFSIGLWMKAKPIESADYLLSATADFNAGEYTGYSLLIWASGEFTFYKAISSVGVERVDSSPGYGDEKWHYVTVTVSSVDGMNMYIDGTSVDTDATATSNVYYDATTPYFDIGDHSNDGVHERSFNGTIDEVLIANRSFSAEEIRNLYNGGRNGFANFDSSLTEKGDNITIEMTPYTYNETGASLNSTPLTILNSPVTHSTPRIGSKYNNKSNQVLHLGFENNFKDNSTAGNDGTPEGDVSITFDGAVGSGIDLEGNGYVQIPEYKSDIFTYSMWFKFSALNTENLFGNAGAFTTYIRYQEGNRFNIEFDTTLTNYQWITPINTNEWYFFVVVKNATHIKYYLNDESLTIALSGGNDNFSLTQIGSNGGNGLNGSIDEVMIFNTSKSAEQISQIYNNTKGFYEEGTRIKTTQDLTVSSNNSNDDDNDGIVYNIDWYINDTLNASTLGTDANCTLWMPFDYNMTVNDNITFDYCGANDGVVSSGNVTFNATGGKIGGAFFV